MPDQTQLTDMDVRYFILACPAQGLQHWCLLDTANTLEGVEAAMGRLHSRGFHKIIACQQTHHLQIEVKTELSIVTDGGGKDEQPLKLKRRENGTLTLTKEPK